MLTVKTFYGSGVFCETCAGLFPDPGMWQVCARCNDVHGFHTGERSVCASSYFIGDIHFDDYDNIELTRFDYFYFLHYKLNGDSLEE